MSPREKNIRQRLVDRQAQILRDSAGSIDDRVAVDLDPTRVGRLSRLDALQMQAMSAALEGRRQQDLKKIEAALRRLDGGEYGDCLKCGEAIARRRLESDPAAPLCAACAR